MKNALKTSLLGTRQTKFVSECNDCMIQRILFLSERFFLRTEVSSNCLWLD